MCEKNYENWLAIVNAIIKRVPFSMADSVDYSVQQLISASNAMVVWARVVLGAGVE